MKIELDDYETVNLLSALRASGVQDSYPTASQLPFPNALSVLNSGDWLGQLVGKLEESLELRSGESVDEFHSKRYGIMHPNFTPTEYVSKATQRLEEHKAEIARLFKERVRVLIDYINTTKDE